MARDSGFELKSISKQSVSSSLERAERYRLLNEPREAQSICLDILEIDPENTQAMQTLLLALTDQFACGAGKLMEQAKQLLPRLGEYEQRYYAGIISERFARHQLDSGHPGSSSSAYVYLCEAMKYYDEAHHLAPAGNDEAVLRHNTCVRTIEWHHLVAPTRDDQELPLE